MDADELSALTDAIHRAWKLQDGITLHHLIRQLDGDQLVVIVNPKFHDPTVIVGSITDVQTLLQRYGGGTKVADRLFAACRELEEDTPIDGYVVPETVKRR